MPILTAVISSTSTSKGFIIVQLYQLFLIDADNDPESQWYLSNGTGSEYAYYLKDPELVGESNDTVLNWEEDLKI